MPTLAARVIGALLALAGLVLTVVGLWYATHLGGSGTATFTATATGTQPVLVPQTVLNRTDDPVTVRVVPKAGGTAWLAAAAPSDTIAVVEGTARTIVTGVDTRPWELRTRSEGTGAAPNLRAADVWRATATGTGPVTMTIEQADAPETVVAAATSGRLDRVELTWERSSWFVQAVIATLVGLLLLVGGLGLVWSTLRGRRTRTDAIDATDGTRPTTTEEVSA